MDGCSISCFVQTGWLEWLALEHKWKLFPVDCLFIWLLSWLVSGFRSTPRSIMAHISVSPRELLLIGSTWLCKIRWAALNVIDGRSIQSSSKCFRMGLPLPNILCGLLPRRTRENKSNLAFRKPSSCVRRGQEKLLDSSLIYAQLSALCLHDLKHRDASKTKTIPQLQDLMMEADV